MIVRECIDSKNVKRNGVEVQAEASGSRVNLSVYGPDRGLYSELRMSEEETFRLIRVLLVSLEETLDE
jgi:hypothetical protein